MRRWEIRRYIQDTKPFEPELFMAVLLEKLSDKNILSDQDHGYDRRSAPPGGSGPLRIALSNT